MKFFFDQKGLKNNSFCVKILKLYNIVLYIHILQIA